MNKPEFKKPLLPSQKLKLAQNKTIIISEIKIPNLSPKYKLGTTPFSGHKFSHSVSRTPQVTNSYANKKNIKSRGALKYVAKVLAVVVLGLVSSLIPPGLISKTGQKNSFASISIVNAFGDSNLDVWWPTDHVSISGSQPFKALVQDLKVSDYTMYWQVDSGQKNIMDSSNQDYPHKEALVDLSNWNWKGSGPYAITFSAFDSGSQKIAEKNLIIYINKAGMESFAAPSPTPTPTPTPVRAQASSPSNFITLVSATTVTTNTPSPQTQKLDIWWPTNFATISGMTPLKAILQNMSTSDYTMYWQVDSGSLHQMENNYQDYPHKEALVDTTTWNWKGSGPYSINFVAKNNNGQILGQSMVYVNVTRPLSAAVNNTIVTAPAALQLAQPINNSNPFSGAKLYVNPYSDPARQANAWRYSRPSDAASLDKVASGAEVEWFGNWNSNVQADANNTVTAITNAGALPVLVAYNIPNRDCGGYSSGGISSADGYKSWIRQMASGIGHRKAVVILEPDGLALTDCLSSSDLQTRFSLISDAVSVFKQNGQSVYIDAAHPNWISAGDMISRLRQAGVDKADGFALNIANFFTNAENITYGQNISNQIGGKHFIIDTGRNGSGTTADYQWCNPPGRSLGAKPTTNTGNSLVDAFLWVKGPGGSDGNCNGGPNAGQFFADYAVGLAQRASW